MILVPLPRRVGPMAKPPFWRSRRLHPRTPRPDSVCLAHADAAPEASALLPVFRFAPTAEIGGDRSGMEDISPATRAIAPQCQAPRTPHSAQNACHATDDRDYRPAARRAAPALPPTTVLRLTPNVQPSALAEKHRAPTECTKRTPQMFMRLVLVAVPTGICADLASKYGVDQHKIPSSQDHPKAPPCNANVERIGPGERL